MAPAARPAKTRYFKGKGPELRDSDSDSDNEQVKPDPIATKKRDENYVAGGAGRLITNKDVQRGLGKDGGVKMSLADVQIGGPTPAKEDSESEEESEEEEEEVKPKAGVALKPPGDESSEYETDSEEESEEEKKPVFRPVFVKKDKRGKTQATIIAEAEEAARLEEELQAQRKADSKELAGETIRRELAEKEAGSELQPDVDDTDGLDPALEFDEWRARELARLLRDKQAQAERDQEQEEIERRRALPEEQRMAEDMAFADQTRAKDKGQMGFLQKYYHRGVFHAGGEADELLNRDYTAATESAVDMSMLPKVMQVKNFGKASRTKYTHLTDQDTSSGGWGNAARQPMGGPGTIGTTETGCWNCGGPHQRKDCPNNDINNNDPMSIVPGYQGQGQGQDRGYGQSSGNGNYSGNSSYGQEGKQRRFDEERSGSGGYGQERTRDEGYARRPDRDEGYSRRDDRSRRDDEGGDRKRHRSRSPRRERERERDDRRTSDRDRERDRRRD